MMIGFLFDVFRETWGILEDASVFLLFGFLLAGVLAVLVPGRLLTRLVGALRQVSSTTAPQPRSASLRSVR